MRAMQQVGRSSSKQQVSSNADASSQASHSQPLVIKSLWAMVQGDPVFMRRVNGWLTIFWVAMIPISIVTGWVHSVVYVSALSLWALVSGHLSAWQAARVEVKQDSDE